MGVRVGDRPGSAAVVDHIDPLLPVELLAGRDQAVLQGSGGSDDLKDRAGFEHVGDCPVLHQSGVCV